MLYPFFSFFIFLENSTLKYVKKLFLHWGIKMPSYILCDVFPIFTAVKFRIYYHFCGCYYLHKHQINVSSTTKSPPSGILLIHSTKYSFLKNKSSVKRNQNVSSTEWMLLLYQLWFHRVGMQLCCCFYDTLLSTRGRWARRGWGDLRGVFLREPKPYWKSKVPRKQRKTPNI